MGNYLGMRIAMGAMDYVRAVTAYPQFKEGVDAYLVLKGREDLIVEIPEEE